MTKKNEMLLPGCAIKPKESDIIAATLATLAFKGLLVVKATDNIATLPIPRGCLGMVWRNNTGMAMMEYNKKKRPVRFGGCRGASDLFAILAPWGVFVAIEMKTPDGETSKQRKIDQAGFSRLVTMAGGYYARCTSAEEVWSDIERIRAHQAATWTSNRDREVPRGQG